MVSSMLFRHSLVSSEIGLADPESDSRISWILECADCSANCSALIPNDGLHPFRFGSQESGTTSAWSLMLMIFDIFKLPDDEDFSLKTTSVGNVSSAEEDVFSAAEELCAESVSVAEEFSSAVEELSMLLELIDDPSVSFFGELTSLSLLQLAQNRAVETRKRFLKCLWIFINTPFPCNIPFFSGFYGLLRNQYFLVIECMFF